MKTVYKSIFATGFRGLLARHIHTFNQIPGMVIIHETENWTVVYMNERGLGQLKLSIQEVCSLTNEEYVQKFFDADDSRYYIPRITDFIQADNREDTLSYYQQLRFPGTDDLIWHLSSTKIFMRDKANKPALSLTISIPLDVMHHMGSKAERLLKENNFFRDNYANFSKLSKREKTILREMALGKSSMEIAAQLYISSTTVDTHRRNVRNKLGTRSSFEISQYARVFGLI